MPSFNEAQNIQNITQVVDRGLSEFLDIHSDFEAIIVNVDSNSTDGTAKMFSETQTVQSKHSIIIDGPAGKGRNILEFCSYVLANNIDLCLTIDTDITSARPDWVIRFLRPLIKEDASYVIPIYERSRFEGSSTNHFAFPLIYAIFDRSVRQPIAGDFAFTRMIAEAIKDSELANSEPIQRYGIDIFMTMTALARGKKIAQIDLEKKIHSPSFKKLEYMFPQIAAATVLSSSHLPPSGESHHESSSVRPNILSDLNFMHKNTAIEMKERALNTMRYLNKTDWIGNQSISSFIEVAENPLPEEHRMADVWTSVLANWMKYFSRQSIAVSDAEHAGNELLSFFVLRAANFWFWAETVGVEGVENAIKKQAELLRNKIRKK